MNVILIAINVLVYVALLPQMSTPANPGDPRVDAYVKVMETEGRLPPAQAEEMRKSVTEYDLTVYEYGSKPNDRSLLDMLTSMFLHGGFMHLAGNMLFLWIYGNNVEFRLGKVKYLIAYLLTGFLASFGDIALRPDSGIPGVGASGAISGVLGMYFIWFPKNRVRLLILMPPMVRQMEIGARIVLGFYIVAQNILPAVMAAMNPEAPGGGVAHGAHIGGFLGGLVLAVLALWRSRIWPARGRAPDERPRPGETAEARKAPGGLGGAFRDALARGDVDRATRLFFEADRRDLEKADLGAGDAIRLGTALLGTGQTSGALAAFENALRLEPDSGETSDAHLGAARALLDRGQATSAYQHVVEAVSGAPTPGQVHEARELMREVSARSESIPSRFASI